MKQLLFMAVLAGCLAAPQTVAQTQNRVEHKVVKTNQTTIRDNSKPKSVNNTRSIQAQPVKTSRDGSHVSTRPQVGKETLNKARTQQRKSNRVNVPKTTRKQSHEAKAEKLQQLDQEKKAKLERLSEAELRLKRASSEKDKAQRELDALIERQRQEMLKLEARHSKEAANGWTEEMRQRHEREINELDARHARERMDLQHALDQAMTEYDTALDIRDAARRAVNK